VPVNPCLRGGSALVTTPEFTASPLDSVLLNGVRPLTSQVVDHVGLPPPSMNQSPFSGIFEKEVVGIRSPTLYLVFGYVEVSYVPEFAGPEEGTSVAE